MSDLEKARLDFEWSWINRVPTALVSLVVAWFPPLSGAWNAVQSDQMSRRLLELKTRLTDLDHNFLNTLRFALNLLPDNCNPDGLDGGKINQIFEAMRLEPNEFVQSMWAQVLAGELENPGSFSRSTIRLLKEIDQATAEDFKAVCRCRCYMWAGEGNSPIKSLFVAGRLVEERPGRFKTETREFYEKHGVTISSLSKLNDIGLIHFEKIAFQGWQSWMRRSGISFRTYARVIRIAGVLSCCLK